MLGLNNIRSYSVIFLVAIAFIVIGARIVTLHVVDRDFLKNQGDARSIRVEKINAHRGMIKDRLGKPLAISSPVVSLWANPKELLAGDQELDLLSAYLDVDNDVLLKRLGDNADKNFVYLRRQIPPYQGRKVLALGINGVYEEKEYHRFYPAGEVAAHVVGYTNIDDKGQEGVELAYDEWLKGTPGKKKVLKNLYGQIIRDIKPLKEVKPGRDLLISLDLRIQYLAYRELKSAISHLNAKSGSVVILDVETGSILGMVNQPSFNPNNKQNLDMAAVRNRAVTDVFEPGSTVKPFTVAVALQNNSYTISSVIDTNPGFIKIGTKMIKDPRNRGRLRLGEIIAYSSQVGITKLALSLDEYEIWNMFYAVGFGQTTGTGFPGEVSGYLPNYRRWKDIDRAAFAYGYGLNVTPLQLATAYLTIATGGISKPVSLMQGSNSEGKRVMSKEVAKDLKAMLNLVITEGTGSKARINSYSVAGKTGTVRKIGKNGYENTSHLAFFAGMTPFKNPKLVGVVLINDPKTLSNGGGANAAPIFSRIMSGALKLLDIPPDKYRRSV